MTWKSYVKPNFPISFALLKPGSVINFPNKAFTQITLAFLEKLRVMEMTPPAFWIKTESKWHSIDMLLAARFINLSVSVVIFKLGVVHALSILIEAKFNPFITS